MSNQISVGDVVKMPCGYGVVQQIIGEHCRVLLTGQCGYGNWFTINDIVDHAALYPR